ncbi:MAG: HAD family phosphatase [Candidatus Glassbacteria bacterium]|nr:HAD family phosphatase [Candidatus Glassbacteria bacterium]
MIKNILFDIGSVLVLGDPAATAAEFALYSDIPADRFTAGQVFLPGVQLAFERGEVSAEQYYRAFLETSRCRVSFRHFSVIWAKHFVEIPQMTRLGRELAGSLKVFFLSNTNPLHIPALYHLFPGLLFFHGQALSYELGVLKPEPAFYQRALEKLELDPGECLFVDDLADNVAAARQVGMQALRHLDPGRTASGIREVLERQGR